MENVFETVKIPSLSIERKAIPVICSWCDRITSITEWEVESGNRIAPTHGICEDCLEIASQGVFSEEQNSVDNNTIL